MKKFLIFAISLAIIISCTIKKPEAPEWDVELTVPLMNENYFVKDIADTTDDFIIFDDNDTMRFTYIDTLDTVRVEDKLNTEGTSESFQELIGDELSINDRTVDFEIDIGDSLRISEQNKYYEYPLEKIEVEETGKSKAVVYLLDFAQEALGDSVGEIYNQIIPPLYNSPPIDTTFTVFENDNIESVTIDSGFAYVDLHNKSQLPISSDDPAHYMTMQIYGVTSRGRNELIIEKEIDHVVEAGSTENISFNLAGKSVYRDNYLEVSLTTDGTSPEPIDVVDTSRFVVQLSVSDMIVESASAKLPSETIIKQESISLTDMNDEINISSAIIDSCMADIKINNNLPLSADVFFVFDELLDTSGQPFEFTDSISQGLNVFNINLENFEIQPGSKQIVDSLHFTYKVVTKPTDEYVTINNTQSVACDFNLSQMWFEEVSGRVNRDYEINKQFDLSDETDKITLEEAIFLSGVATIDISGLSFEPQLEITFDQIKDNQLNPLVLTNDDFSGYDFGDNPDRIIIDTTQIVSYQVLATMPDEIITISKNDQVTAEIELTDFIFSQITGQFQSFSIEDSGATEIDSTGEYELQYAEIDSCDAYVSISTDPPLPINTDVTLTFDEIYTQTKSPLTLTLSVPGDTMISFAGYTIGESEASTEIIDSLHYFYEATTTPTNQTVTLHYEDEINADIEIGKILFNTVKGNINNKTFEVDPQETTIDLGDFPDSLDNAFIFSNAELQMNIYNGLGFSSLFNTTIYGFNTRTGEGKSIQIYNEMLQPNQSNIFYKDVSDFLSIIPDSIYVDTIRVVVNGSGTITKTDSIRGRFKLRTPLKFVINDKSGIKMDSLQHIEIDADAQTKIENNLDRVKALITLENKLPFGLTTYLNFALDSNYVWSDPALTIDSLLIEPAEIDTVNQTSGEATTSQMEILLTQEDGDLSVFTNPDVYMGVKFDLIGSNGESVYINGNDKINVKGVLKVRVHIDEGLTEE